MNKTYEKEFNKEIERILNKIYYHPINNDGKYKKAVIDWDYKYTQYLIENELIRYINSHSPTSVMLKTKGYEVFEKYKGWHDYRKKVIDKKIKTEEAKNLAQRFWWLPIIISGFALFISAIAIING